MSVTAVERRLADRWPAVALRAEAFQRSIPAEGMTRNAYVSAVLPDIDPAMIGKVLALLQDRGFAWVRTVSGNMRVYASRPSSIAVEGGTAASKKGMLCRAVAGHMLALAEAERARKSAVLVGWWEEEAERSDEVVVHFSRIAKIILQHEVRGLALADARHALQQCFDPVAFGVLARREPKLHATSSAESIRDDAEPLPSRTRIPSGLSLAEQALARIQTAGPRGIVRKDLKDSFTPKLNADDLDAVVKPLEADGLIVSKSVKQHKAGRPGLYYFHSSIAL